MLRDSLSSFIYILCVALAEYLKTFSFQNSHLRLDETSLLLSARDAIPPPTETRWRKGEGEKEETGEIEKKGRKAERTDEAGRRRKGEKKRKGRRGEEGERKNEEGMKEMTKKEVEGEKDKGRVLQVKSCADNMMTGITMRILSSLSFVL